MHFTFFDSGLYDLLNETTEENKKMFKELERKCRQLKESGYSSAGEIKSSHFQIVSDIEKGLKLLKR
jgi:hypothetical protein